MDNHLTKDLIFGFDIGAGSLGVAVREGNLIKEANSYLLEADHGTAKEARKIRGQFRTRKAHRTREKALHNAWEAMGKALPSDEQLKREFPKKGDDTTVYNSALLRIKLFEGKPLEDWQVYKALWSAIQRRGYDKDVPWKQSADGDKEDKEAKETVKLMNEFENKLREEMTDDERYHYPCYHNAWRMGLWCGKTKSIKSVRINKFAGRARGYIASREQVECEVIRLLENAGIAKDKTREILYGKSRKEEEEPKPYQSATEIEGILNQKHPRFDNRCVNECRLFPKYQVVRSGVLSGTVTFLKKLIDFRFQDGDRNERGFSVGDIRELLRLREEEAKKAILKDYCKLPKMSEEKKKQAKGSSIGSFKPLIRKHYKELELSVEDAKELKKLKEEAKKAIEKVDEKILSYLKITKDKLTKYVEKHYSGSLLPTCSVVEAPKATGRSAHCRPALHLIKELILSGKSPGEFYKVKQEEFQGWSPEQQKKSPITLEDLEVLRAMGETWEQIHIPNRSPLTPERTPEDVYASCRNGVVRHRVGFFYKTFKALVKEHGEPKEVHIEFVREDFLGEKAKREHEKFINENRKKNDATKEDMQKAGHGSFGKGSAKRFRMFKLAKQQDWQCLYTGEALCTSKMEEYHVDHIVPRAQGGNDADYNLVLTTRDANKGKGKLTPYEWLKKSGKWDAYVKRVEGSKLIGKKKKKILTSKNPLELINKYTKLAETAWIARLTQEVVYAHYKREMGAKREDKLVRVIDGQTTAVLRRFKGLNKLLGEPIESIEQEELDKLSAVEREKKLDEQRKKIEKKNRDDKRHHALDAMVLTYAGEWMRNRENYARKGREERWKMEEKGSTDKYAKDLGNSINEEARASIVEHLERVMPRKVVSAKHALGETYYAMRKDPKDEYKAKMYKRKDLLSYKENKDGVKSEIKMLGETETDRKNILDREIAKRLKAFFTKHPKGSMLEEDRVKAFEKKFHSNGKSIVKKCMCYEGEVNDYKCEKRALYDKGKILGDETDPIKRKKVLDKIDRTDRDRTLAKRLEAFFTAHPKGSMLEEDRIKAFKEEFHSGKNGKSIVKKCEYMYWRVDKYKDVRKKNKKKGGDEENEEVDKKKKGQYSTDRSITGKGTFRHGCYLKRKLNDNPKRRVEVHPVHAFESPKKVKACIENDPDYELLFKGRMLKSGVTVFKLNKDFKHSKWDIPQGLYTLKGLLTSGPTKIESRSGKPYGDFQINDLYRETDLEMMED